MLLYNFCTLRQPLSCLYHYIILICFRVLTPQRCFKNLVVLLAMTMQAILFYSFKVLDGFQWSVMFCTFLNGTTSHYLNFETYKCYLKGKYQIQAFFLKNTGMKKNNSLHTKKLQRPSRIFLHHWWYRLVCQLSLKGACTPKTHCTAQIDNKANSAASKHLKEVLQHGFCKRGPQQYKRRISWTAHRGTQVQQREA